MKANYRHEARNHFKDAKNSLKKKGCVEARSAALSLRLCMEALTYERAQVYQYDLPTGKFEVWQPRILMIQMLEIDPYADQDSTMSFGLESTPGVPAEKMTLLGTEKPIKLSVLKDHYDALGSYLHMPTIRKIENGKKFDEQKLRSRCQIIINELEINLSSTLWKASLNFTASQKCCECGETIKRRFKDGDEPRPVSCHECGMRYTLECVGTGKVHWKPHQQKVVCLEESCKCEFYIPSHQIIHGAEFDCMDCCAKMIVGLAVFLEPEGKKESS